MAILSSRIRLYADSNGVTRKTRSGHYRFDLIQTRENGTPYASIMGLRFDAERKRILPVTITVGGNLYIVAEIAPEEHPGMVEELLEAIGLSS